MENKEYYDRLSKLIEFRDGKPYWLRSRSNVKCGAMAGTINSHGYRFISTTIGGHSRTISAHRLSFYMYNGYLPRTVDHIDCIKDNNEPDNLRPCTRSQNGANIKKRNGCSSQFKGVCWNRGRGKWQSKITVNYKTIHLGRFESEVSAALAYNEAAIRYFGEFSFLNNIEMEA